MTIRCPVCGTINGIKLQRDTTFSKVLSASLSTDSEQFYKEKSCKNCGALLTVSVIVTGEAANGRTDLQE